MGSSEAAHSLNEYLFQVSKFSTIRPRTSLELGALNGDYTKEFQRRFGIREEDATLVEPNPAWAEALREAFPRARVVEAALGSLKATQKLHRVTGGDAAMQGCSSLLPRIDGWQKYLEYDAVTVEVIRGSDLLDEAIGEIDLCVVDVEGMAFEVLQSFGDRIHRIRSLMVECEHTRVFQGQHLYADVQELLNGFGFQQMAFRYAYADQSDSAWIRSDCVDLHFREGRE